MKSLTLRVSLLLGVFAASLVGCAAQVEDEVLDEDLGEEEVVASEEQALTTQPLLCQDQEYIDLKLKTCPLPYAPVHCQRDCIAYRHYAWVPGSPGSFQCVVYDRECESTWECESCPNSYP